MNNYFGIKETILLEKNSSKHPENEGHTLQIASFSVVVLIIPFI